VCFKKAQVCKVIKEIMALKACYTFNEGETLNFQEANKLMHLGDVLEYAVQVYEDVRMKRLAFFKDTFRQITPSGKVYLHVFVNGVCAKALTPTDYVCSCFRAH
jgi:TRAP-type C4-dicarboxylate transport system substrate-binding protein